MKQKDFILEVNRGISCYSCCHTGFNITYGQQEITKRAPNIVGCSKPIIMD